MTTTPLQDLARVGLGTFLVGAGLSHLTVAREGFRAQVPPWVPIDVDDTVVISGCAEVALGTALVAFPKERVKIGTIAALFFTAVFPGNIAQWRHRRDGLGLNSDRMRFLRLFAQPVPIAVALWSTGVVPRR
ncbi:DoxX family protein [Actinomycetospora corticicola]|jgi:uncharacterized membrane protein|uniref:Putative membrane protein n=1 Tax=Actinomycetospora corticicola TaxID=663602 RepID=A0A7Y9E1X7_9PSEU|nr:hypothetical protein [Actinomycetospora corticicola]NYD39481.1 putative membrane protein [Actinomycetospora corticicola]